MCMMCEDKFFQDNEYVSENFGYDKSSISDSGQNTSLRLIYRESDKSYALWIDGVIDEIFPVFYCPLCGGTLKELPKQHPVGNCVVTDEDTRHALIHVMKRIDEICAKRSLERGMTAQEVFEKFFLTDAQEIQ